MSRGRPVALRLTLAVLLSGPSCATVGWQAVAPVQEIKDATEAPVVLSANDLGALDLPAEGIVETDRRSDGVASIGEVIWIQGQNFGPNPSVEIGGVAVEVKSRTANEGILARVPPGTPVGTQPVVVSTQHGQHQKTVVIKRLAIGLPPQAHSLAWANVANDAPVAVNFVDLVSPRFIRLSADGRAAYVIGGNPLAMTVFEMAAAHQPTAVGKLDLGAGRAWAFVAAAAAPVVALLREQDVAFFDTSSALHPVAKDTQPLPPAVRAAGPRRVELSPDGKLLVFCVAEGNQILVVEVADLALGDRAVVTKLALEPGVRVPILSDLAFAADGKTLWVVSGDNSGSAVAGPQITRAYGVRVVRQKDGVKLRLARTANIEAAGNPVRIHAGHADASVKAAANRLPPERATTVYLTAASRDGQRSCVYALGVDNKVTEVISVEGKDRIGTVEVSSDGRWVIAATVGDDGAFQMATAPVVSGTGWRQFVNLVDGPDRKTTLPSGATGEIRLQP